MMKFAAIVTVGIMATTPLAVGARDTRPQPSPPKQHFVVAVARIAPIPVTEWDTTDTDSTAYLPKANDPITNLPPDAQKTFACIRYAESRNHPTSRNITSGAGGLYQILTYIWLHYGGGKYAPSADLATPQEQGQIASTIYLANHGFYPEWTDGCK